MDAVVDGLSQDQKQLPCKFFYDAEGSKLFDAICELDEYYPTRTELGLLQNHCGEISDLIGPGAELIEFGCGSLQKIRILLAAMDTPAGFVPIDISREHLLLSAEDLAAEFPALSIRPVVADYTQPLDLPVQDNVAKRVGFFPGSTIGNFTREEAVRFLKVVAGILGRGGELLIGVDLKKDTAILNAAYNDQKGVTAAFNLNILERINRELGGDFDIDAFRHNAFYASDQGRIEMHIESLKDQTVKINGSSFDFESGETIHTENSHKYGVEEFVRHAGMAGFVPVQTWTDEKKLFSIHYLRVS
ncbi:MAG: L-histidine N(alpha)-methyltransferase [Alphaproteobacteria bacterium]